MFRVPRDAAQPTFDSTIKIGFWKWLSSSKADRTEWARRRNAAAKFAATNQAASGQAWLENKAAKLDDLATRMRSDQ